MTRWTAIQLSIKIDKCCTHALNRTWNCAGWTTLILSLSRSVLIRKFYRFYWNIPVECCSFKFGTVKCWMPIGCIWEVWHLVKTVSKFESALRQINVSLFLIKFLSDCRLQRFQRINIKMFTFSLAIYVEKVSPSVNITWKWECFPH